MIQVRGISALVQDGARQRETFAGAEVVRQVDNPISDADWNPKPPAAGTGGRWTRPDEPDPSPARAIPPVPVRQWDDYQFYQIQSLPTRRRGFDEVATNLGADSVLLDVPACAIPTNGSLDRIDQSEPGAALPLGACDVAILKEEMA